ncbi:MAG: M23 family metallopeptidase [Ignavibacteriales bacterium]|nr:M23 family metallopeptidase [Ignavibacteriales bacterium]
MFEYPKSKLSKLQIITYSIIISLIIFQGYYFFVHIFDASKEYESLSNEKILLESKYNELLEKYQSFTNKLDTLIIANNDLRKTLKLEQITIDDYKFGTGEDDFDLDFTNDISSFNNVLDKLNSLVEGIEIKLAIEKSNYSDLKKKILLDKKYHSNIPAVKPCEGMYSTKFGMRIHPILKINQLHSGVDIITPTNTPVIATGGGTIDFVGRNGGFGLTIRINHGYGFSTVYSHLEKSFVIKGQKVIRGQVIANSGNSGISTGPHLHYEVRHDNVPLNPKNFIFDSIDLFYDENNKN